MTPTLKCETDKKITQDVTTGKITLVFKEHFPRVGECITLQKGKKRKQKLFAEWSLLSKELPFPTIIQNFAPAGDGDQMQC